MSAGRLAAAREDRKVQNWFRKFALPSWDEGMASHVSCSESTSEPRRLSLGTTQYNIQDDVITLRRGCATSFVTQSIALFNNVRFRCCGCFVY